MSHAVPSLDHRSRRNDLLQLIGSRGGVRQKVVISLSERPGRKSVRNRTIIDVRRRVVNPGANEARMAAFTLIFATALAVGLTVGFEPSP